MLNLTRFSFFSKQLYLKEPIDRIFEFCQVSNCNENCSHWMLCYPKKSHWDIYQLAWYIVWISRIAASYSICICYESPKKRISLYFYTKMCKLLWHKNWLVYFCVWHKACMGLRKLSWELHSASYHCLSEMWAQSSLRTLFGSPAAQLVYSGRWWLSCHLQSPSAEKIF